MKRRIAIALTGLLLLFVWTTAVWAQAEAPIVHTVESGETLFGIAQQYGTTVEAIAAANNLTDVNALYVGQELIIPVGSGANTGASDTFAYRVVPGDTLDAVARRFDTTVSALAELNGVVSPDGLWPGSQLWVPSQEARRLHRVAAGETALTLALRYDVPLWEFLTTNGLNSPAALLPGQQVWVPMPAVTSTLPAPFEALDVGPLPVMQGHTVRVKAELADGAEVQGVFDDQVLHFAAEDDAYYALFGIHALSDPGRYTLALLATDAAGDTVYWSQPIDVLDGGYGYEEIHLSADRDAMLAPEALAAERARLDEIRPVFTPQRYWDGLFTRPITTELTSFFGTRRLYQSPSYQFYGYHEGTDFNGEVGTPVHAPAAGVVVLAEPLYVRGNAIVIDHGWGVYTGYWHLSEIKVQVGRRVAPGDLIGLVGHTGLSTGAHLHWDFWVNGTNVSALQWTEQAFP